MRQLQTVFPLVMLGAALHPVVIPDQVLLYSPELARRDQLRRVPETHEPTADRTGGEQAESSRDHPGQRKDTKAAGLVRLLLVRTTHRHAGQKQNQEGRSSSTEVTRQTRRIRGDEVDQERRAAFDFRQKRPETR